MQYKIMIVEDEAIVASDIEECLKSQGYLMVDIVSSGGLALERAKELRPDLVLMDVKLEGEMDGIAAASYLKDTLHIPVIYLTAYADDDTLQRAKVTEPYGYILKPFKELELKTAIEIALYRAYQGQDRQGPTEEPKSKVREGETKEEPLCATMLEVYNFLQQIQPFSSLSEATLKMVAKACRFSEFKAGDYIALEGDQNVSGFALITGRLAMLKTSTSGKDLIVELIPPGDTFGLIAAMDNSPYSVTVRAQLDSRVLWIPRTLVLRVLDQHPELARKFFQDVFDRLRKAQDISRALAHDRVEVRIASALAALVPRFVGSIKNTDLKIRMTRQELAELTGASTETAIRMTKAMERDGLLDLSQPSHVRILDLEGLREMAEGAL